MSVENVGDNVGHPSHSDPKEVRIAGLIKSELTSTLWARNIFARAKDLQLNYFLDSLKESDPNLIFAKTQHLLKTLAEITQSKIVDGQNYLGRLDKKAPIFVVLNHLGAYKLTEIKEEEVGVKFETPDTVLHPFPIYFSSVFPIAEKLHRPLLEAHVDLSQLSNSLTNVQKAAELLLIPTGNQRGGANSFDVILERTKEIINKRPTAMIVIFSEGGTSGKRNMGGPYDLDKFHGGSFAIAEELRIQVLPVCQYFNPNSGFEVGILESIVFNAPAQDDIEGRKEYFRKIANTTHNKMQAWLNHRKQLVASR